MNDLDKALYQYSRSDIDPFHMPGHKRQVQNEYLCNPLCCRYHRNYRL